MLKSISSEFETNVIFALEPTKEWWYCGGALIHFHKEEILFYFNTKKHLHFEIKECCDCECPSPILKKWNTISKIKNG